MASVIDRKLSNLGISLPIQDKPLANYVPYVLIDGLVFVSGQLPLDVNGIRYTGQLAIGNGWKIGFKAAHLCAINLLAQLKVACEGDLDKVTKVIKLTGYVSSSKGFCDHSKVIDGASDLMVDVFGQIGRHARAAVGTTSLPMNASVEVDGIFGVS